MLLVTEEEDLKSQLHTHGIKRKRPTGCRNYLSSKERTNVLNGMGIAILTTSKGVMSNKKAKLNNVGGEVLCHVW